MRFLTDECVQDSVGQFLQERGHEVVRARDVFAPKTPDPVIAKQADDDQAIVITNNSKDFKALISRLPGGRARYRHAGLITFEGCEGPTAARRLEQLIESIEFEADLLTKHQDQRLIITIRRFNFLVRR